MHNIPNLVSIKDFYEILNASASSPIGEAAIYQLVKTPGFPALTIGNRYFILIDKVQEWMENQFAEKADLEPNSEAN